MALCADVVPPADRAVLVEDIVADLEKRGWQQTPGDVGHVYFIRALAEAGRSDVLHRVYSRDGLGSYGGILKKGPDLAAGNLGRHDGRLSIAEPLHAGPRDGVVLRLRRRHPASPGRVGWKQILIAPKPGPLTWARGSLETPAGRIVSRWRIEEGEFRLKAEIPAGVEATALLPSGRRQPLRTGVQELIEPVQQRAGQ